MKAAKETGHILTAEDHNIIGGLGSAVAEVLSECDIPVKFKRLGIPDKFAPIGLHEDIMSILGIDSNGIISAVFDSLGVKKDDDDNWDDEV